VVVIVGAGAAGLMAAIFAAGTGADVIVLERTTDGGRKILISGGGRCNVLPAALEPDRFISASPAHLVRHLLRAWPLEHQKAFFENEIGIPLKFEAEDRKYFPVSDRARDVRDGLIEFARRRGVGFQFSTSLTGLAKTADGWRVETTKGTIDASSVILATGGLSVPATGSDGTGLRLAESLGHTIHDLYPALTPLTADPPVHAELSGVSLHVRLRAKEAKPRGKTRESHGGFLFTHRGYSGPSVLDISDVCTRSKHASLRAQWGDLDATAWEPLLTGGLGSVAGLIAGHLPQRLVDQLMREANVPLDRRVSDLRRSERIALIERLTSCPLPWTGDEGYKKAEVTGGGVALEEVDLRTLESKIAPGLFLCGEMLDAFGPIGGHNFAWSWSTGRAAGIGASALLGHRAKGTGHR
jgi:predicted Rossmann fold flavoprotein